MEDQIISLLKQRGPLLPSDLSKQLNTNTVFAGAHLSTLAQKNKVNISNIKIGSSPLYYLPEQKNRLEQFANHLGEKDKRAFDLLKQKKVLRDKDQDPLARVSLRNIKDFAVQLYVTVGTNKEIFWKFYSATDAEVNALVREILEPPALRPVQEIKKEEKEIKKPEKELKKEAEIREKHEKEKPEIKKQQSVKKEEKPEKETIKKEEKITPKHEQKKRETGITEKPLLKERLVISEPVKKEEQTQLVKGRFYSSIESDFAKKGIKITSAEMLLKDKEYDLIIQLPSPAGNLTYYCKAKAKKRINEGDLSAAVLKAQSRRLPALFLTDGDLTKKAEKFLNEELKDQIKVMRL